MKNNFISSRFLIFYFILFASNIYSQENESWRTRINFQTPTGFLEGDTIKDVSIIVNLPQIQGLKYVNIKVGSTEGGSDIYSNEIQILNGTPPPPAYIDEAGCLIITIGQFGISPSAFFIEALLCNQEHQPLQ
jgi:hypothetical protein